jgi:adenine-specific DNA-methyltransferase
MKEIEITSPFQDESPSHFADRLGLTYSSSVSNEHKKDNGQFFTPLAISQFMGTLCTYAETNLRILDPGCGVLILSCSLIEYLVYRNPEIKSIELSAYETDKDLVPYTYRSLDFLKKWVNRKNINFDCQLFTDDFVLSNKECFQVSTSLLDEPGNQIIIKNDFSQKAVDEIVQDHFKLIEIFASNE